MGIKIKGTQKEVQVEAGKLLVEILSKGNPQTKTETGIILPDQEDPDISFRIAKVLDVAPALDKNDPTVQTDRYCEGQTLYITRQGGTVININNKEYWIIQPKDVLARVEE